MTNLNRNLLLGVGTIVLFVLLYYFREIVLYILIAWVLSLLGNPLMRFFRRVLRFKGRYVGDSTSALLTIFCFFALLVIIVMLFVPPVVNQAKMLTNIDYQQLELQLRKPLGFLDVQLHKVGFLGTEESLGTKLKDVFQEWFDPSILGTYAGNILSAAGNTLVLISVVSFILFFFLRDHQLFNEMLYAIVPEKQEENVMHAVTESSQMLTRYLIGLFVQVFCFSIIVGTILFALGIPNAFLIGFFGGVMNLVPYVGPLIGGAFGVFITLSSGLELPLAEIWPQLLKVVGAFAVTQMIDNFLLQPYISSKSVKAHPLEIFLVTLAAAKIGGLAGMVVGIPAYTVLRVIGKTFFSEFKIVRRLTAHEENEASIDNTIS